MYFINATILLHAPSTTRVADHCRNLVVGTVITEVPSFLSPQTKLFPFHHIVFPLFQAPVRCVLTMLSSSFSRLQFLEAKQYLLCSVLSGFPPFKIMQEFQIYAPVSTLHSNTTGCIPSPSLNSNPVGPLFQHLSHFKQLPLTLKEEPKLFPSSLWCVT